MPVQIDHYEQLLNYFLALTNAAKAPASREESFQRYIEQLTGTPYNRPGRLARLQKMQKLITQLQQELEIPEEPEE